MKHALMTALTVLLVTSAASADVLYRGKVYKVTADRLIADRQLSCNYGPWVVSYQPDGALVLTRAKTCTEAK